MMTIMLYGVLGRQFGRVHQYAVKTPREAIKALCVTLPGFRRAVQDGGSYRVIVGGREDLTLEQTAWPVSSRESLRIVPVVAGAGGFGRIIVGAALIAFSIAYPQFGAFNIGSFSSSVASIAGNIGISLVLGGVSQMLFSPPKPKDSIERPENRPSFAFDGAVNTSAQGNPVPVCYGRLIVGSQVISAGLSTEQISA